MSAADPSRAVRRDVLSTASTPTQDFADVYQDHLASVWRYVRSRVWGYHDAQDVTAEVFTRAWRSWSSYNPRKGPVAPWLFRIAQRTVVDFQRRHQGREPIPASGSAELEHRPVSVVEGIDAALLDDEVLTALGEALAELGERYVDCVVLDLKLPGTTGFGLLEQIKKDERFRSVPIIIYTGKELTRREETRLRKYAETIIVKDVTSPERLLDETALYLHRVESALPTGQRRMLEQLHNADAVFSGRRILIVDDDVRNVFALASVLESHGMEVLFAENGREGLETLRENPDVDLVLMDIMMPELDGYEAIRAIRKQKRYEKLPIISLTAKAMKGDREKSIESGASDYIPKPIDPDQLLSLLRVWLYR